MQASDLHNHPHHKEYKIPVKVDTDIRRAVLENPHLKSSDIPIGMLYIHIYICRFFHLFYLIGKKNAYIHTRGS